MSSYVTFVSNHLQIHTIKLEVIDMLKEGLVCEIGYCTFLPII